MGTIKLILICLISLLGLVERFLRIAPCWVPAGMLNGMLPFFDFTLVVHPKTASNMFTSIYGDLPFRYLFLLLSISVNSIFTTKSP